MKTLSSILSLIITVLLLTGPAYAADLDVREHIEVSGTAEVKVVPNEFVIEATVESFDARLDKASKANDEAVRDAFQGLTKLGVDRRYVVTDEIRVNAMTEGYRARGNFRRVGYTVSRNITVVLHDARRIEPAMKRLFAAGVDRLSMRTGHTDLETHLQKARVAAAKDAREKAKTMAQALDRGLGPAVAIAESESRQHQASNSVYTSATPDLGDSMSLGKLKVRASVQVKFLLK